MNKDYTPEEYSKYVDAKAPKSSIVKDTFLAFVIGGLICVVAQLIGDFMRGRGVEEKAVLLWLPIIMIALGAFLTGIGLYSKLGKFAGAGSIVPITGFANAVVSPAIEFKTEGLVLGLAAKMFTIAGPVIVYGTITSIIVGLVYFLIK